MRNRIGAVIVGAGTNGLGIVRALGKSGVVVTVVDVHPQRAAMLSRYSRPRLVTTLAGEEFVSELADVLGEFSVPPVLFVTEETPLMAVSKYRHLIDHLCKMLLPEHENLEVLMSKAGIDSLAVDNGIAVPRTKWLKKENDLESLSTFKFPCIIKPGVKNSLYAGKFKKGYKVASITEAIAIAQQILPVLPDLVIQEWIEGGEADLYFTLVFIDKKGDLVASFTGRKLRCWPLPVGGTASCGPAEEVHELLLAKTVDFFDKTEFTGIGGIEYKRDPRDGEFYMIEPTVSRTDFQHEVAVLNGVNIPYAAYCSLTGQSIPVSKMQSRYAWVETQTERWSRKTSGVPDSEVYGNLIKVGALFRWDDPKPWLVSKYRMLRTRLWPRR